MPESLLHGYGTIGRAMAVVLVLIAAGAGFEAGASQTPQDSAGIPALKQLTLDQLGSIEVTTASKEPEEVWKSPAAIYVVTQEDIRRSGAGSIPEILRLVPGVEVERIDASTWSIGIRGFDSAFSKSVLVVIDGRNVYTPLFAGVNWRLQNVLLEDVARIEVIRGPGGTIWGTNAVSGVINIITKNSKDTRGAFVSIGGGNVEQANAGFRYADGAGANLDYRVYGMAVRDGPESHADHKNFAGWELGQGGFRIDWDNHKRDTLTVQGDLYKGSIGESETIASYSPPASLNVVAPEDISGGNFLLRWRRQVNRVSHFQIEAYYDRTYRLGSQSGETRNTFDIDFIHHLTLFPRQETAQNLLQPSHPEFAGDPGSLVGIKRTVYAGVTWRQ